MTLESASLFFIATFIFGLTPGINVFTLISQALSVGRRSCLALSLGMVASDVIYLLLACFGIFSIAEHWNELFLAIRVIGGGYLFYLAWKLWNASVNIESQISSFDKKLSFLQGFFISISNPKVILYYISFLPNFMDLNKLEYQDIVLVVILTFIARMLGLVLITYFASKVQRFFHSDKSVKIFNRAAGSVMALAGAYLMLSI